jgi:dTDP-D-glucose 4,6-dehydratase
MNKILVTGRAGFRGLYFIETVGNRWKKKVSCFDKIPYKYKYIDIQKLEEIINKSSVDDDLYLKQLIS